MHDLAVYCSSRAKLWPFCGGNIHVSLIDSKIKFLEPNWHYWVVVWNGGIIFIVVCGTDIEKHACVLALIHVFMLCVTTWMVGQLCNNKLLTPLRVMLALLKHYSQHQGNPVKSLPHGHLNTSVLCPNTWFDNAQSCCVCENLYPECLLVLSSLWQCSNALPFTWQNQCGIQVGFLPGKCPGMPRPAATNELTRHVVIKLKV